ncbi:MAG TPA: hypothetical protein VF339_03840 [Gammaproteobacteria bacterium]
MRIVLPRAVRPFVLVALGAHGFAAAQPAQPETAPDPQALADRIQSEVAEIRGLAFARPVRVQSQSPEDFAQYLQRELESVVPPTIAEHYNEIVRKLGLYRGEEDLQLVELMKGVMTSQVAAYYDPVESTFYVLFNELSPLMAGTLYAHELYHGLQDQHFDLEAYIQDGQRNRTLSDDELLARQAVVEGEATYVMTLWMLRNMLGSIPPRAALQQAVMMQSQLDVDALNASLQQAGFASVLGDDFSSALESVDDIPAFIIETLVGAYLKGLGFVFAVEERGWSEVEKLYTEYPPQSTEQILHPEKWFARETPVRFEWPPLASQGLFRGWDVLEQNVVGELQWRIVFAEHGLEAESESAAAGWNGDRWAVLRHPRTGALMLLLRSTWDTEEDAIEFAAAYERLLDVKYAGSDEPTRVVRSGRDVLIVEGGNEESLDAYVDFLASARATQAVRR